MKLHVPAAFVGTSPREIVGDKGKEWWEYRDNTDNKVSVGPEIHMLADFTPIALFRERIMNVSLKYKPSPSDVPTNSLQRSRPRAMTVDTSLIQSGPHGQGQAEGRVRALCQAGAAIVRGAGLSRARSCDRACLGQRVHSGSKTGPGNSDARRRQPGDQRIPLREGTMAGTV